VSNLLAPIRHVLRVTLEAKSPLSIASGESDVDIDTPLFRDWNGLPCISGASLAGVLRSLHEDYFSDTAGLFGFEESGTKDGVASRLLVSFGLAHNRSDRVVETLLDTRSIENDEVLRRLALPAPVLRDHVAIDADTGAASPSGKFDRAACPAGTRFSLELAIDGDDGSKKGDREAMAQLAGLFVCPYLRLGGAGRRGFGAVRLVRARYRALDRRGSKGREDLIAYRSAPLDDFLGKWDSWDRPNLTAHSRRGPITGKLVLAPKGFWRMGEGDKRWLTAPPGEKKPPDKLPLTEPVIVWTKIGNTVTGSVVEKPLAPFPASGLKGALAHRAEYHLRRIRAAFADASAGPGPGGRLMDTVFGSVAAAEGGEAGALLIDDAFVDFDGIPISGAAGRRPRNSLDRQTSGVRDGKFFTFESLWKGPAIRIDLALLAKPRGDVELPDDVLRALDWAFGDLLAGGLAVGGGDAVGDGVMAEGSSISWKREGERSTKFLVAPPDPGAVAA